MEKDFNPFGDRGYQYSPDIAHDSYHVPDTKRNIEWWKLLVLLSAVILIVTFIGNTIFVNNQRQNAVTAIAEFNSAAADVHQIFSSDDSIVAFKGMTNDENLNPIIRESATNVTQIADEYLRGSYYQPIEEDTSGTEAAQLVVPYYTLCDLVIVTSDYINMGEYEVQCDIFSASARDMMSKVTSFNSLNNGVAGFLNPISAENLPDVTG